MPKQVLHDDLMLKLGKIYRKGRFYTFMSFQGIDYERENDVVNIASEIRLALRKIPKDYAMILVNDYFDIKDQNWWCNQYSEQVYYRMKNQAISLLFDLLPYYCISEI